MASGRNSIGYEIDKNLGASIDRIKDVILPTSKQIIRERIARHLDFVIQWLKTKGGFKYENKYYHFPVRTYQEKEIILQDPLSVEQLDAGLFEIEYLNQPQEEFCKDWAAALEDRNLDLVLKNLRYTVTQKKIRNSL